MGSKNDDEEKVKWNLGIKKEEERTSLEWLCEDRSKEVEHEELFHFVEGAITGLKDNAVIFGG
ncbi:Hypothetical predicted protein [Olea europaea subsp. europaea]|uniref:Uncharacterized protein n=1 Tax=Olea europaea subsp. europaea TaxID=158383 RepID=A0A8S0S0Z5_OLEEU|nr:Hypothetical predicted protein [Olea europaea subsp. europaea]